MNRFRKLLGYKHREYNAKDFSVHVEPVFREEVLIVYTRRGIDTALNGTRIGKRWSGIAVCIPQEVEFELLQQIVPDLEIALERMGYSYIVSRSLGVDSVSEPERKAAIAELHEMGISVEVLPDGRIRQTRSPRAPQRDLEAWKKLSPRIMTLMQSVGGKRRRYEVLARSKDFEPAFEPDAVPD